METKNITLSTALKLKKATASELKAVKQKIIQNNSILKNNEYDYSFEDLATDFLKLKEKLINIKTKIRNANGPISETLVKIEEEKDTLAFYINLRENTKDKWNSSYGDDLIEYKSQKSKKEIDLFIEKYKISIYALQEQIDKHNANTLIEIYFV